MSFFLFRGNTNSSLRFRSTVLGCLAIVGLTSFCSRPLTFVFHCGGCSIQHCKCYKESPSFIWMRCLRHAVFEFHGTRLCDQVSDLTLRSRLSSLVAIRLLSMVTQHSIKITEYLVFIKGYRSQNQINRSIEYCCAIPSPFSKCLNSLVLPYGLRWESMIEGCTRHENKSNFVSDNTMRNVESWMRFLQPTTP